MYTVSESGLARSRRRLLPSLRERQCALPERPRAGLSPQGSPRAKLTPSLATLRVKKNDSEAASLFGSAVSWFDSGVGHFLRTPCVKWGAHASYLSSVELRGIPWRLCPFQSLGRGLSKRPVFHPYGPFRKCRIPEDETPPLRKLLEPPSTNGRHMCEVKPHLQQPASAW